MSERITARQFHESHGVQDWRVVSEGDDAVFRTGTFAASARLVNAIGELADSTSTSPISTFDAMASHSV